LPRYFCAFGVQTALGAHEHTSFLWYHGVQYGDTTDGYVHNHMHSSDGAARWSQLAYGRCNIDHSYESETLSTHNFIDVLYGNHSDEPLDFASTRSTQTGMSHHHHNHWYSC
jgi:hypothetical protein